MVAEIRRIYSLPSDVRRLDVLCSAEGYDLVKRLVRDWADGSNGFDRPGEALVEARNDGILIAVGGLNVDPYADDGSVGRLRHVYVDPDFRGRGIGQDVIERLVALARGHFLQVRLRAASPAAGAFYEALGFERTPRERSATHVLVLG